MPISTRHSNKEAHPGYADLPEKRTREESEQSLDQSEVDEDDTNPSQPRKPAKRQKIVAEHKKGLYTLAKLQNKITKAALNNALEAVRPPGPQVTKLPRKPNAEMTQTQSEAIEHDSE